MARKLPNRPHPRGPLHQGTSMRLVLCGSPALLVCVAGALLYSPGDGARPGPVGTRVGDFTLPQPADGRPWSLAQETRTAKAVVVLFLGTACPVSNSYVPTLAAL